MTDEAAAGVQIVGESAVIEALRSTIRRVAPTDLAVLLMGVLSFSSMSDPANQIVGWAALVSIGLWYLLVVMLSVLRKMELPDAFWARAAPRHNEKEIASARSFTPRFISPSMRAWISRIESFFFAQACGKVCW